MVLKPTILPQWATNDVQSPESGQYNVVEPPLEVKLAGWPFDVKPNRQWWNWFQRQSYLFIQWLTQQESYTVTTDGDGIGLFLTENALIKITAVDLDDPTSVYQATGIKLPGLAPQFIPATIVANNLSLGLATASGNVEILGGTNIIVTGFSRPLPS
jgi:hypothetical protein